MDELNNNDAKSNSRRSFLKKFGIGVGIASVASVTGFSLAKGNGNSYSGEMVKLLTPDGKLVEVPKEAIQAAKLDTDKMKEEARKGLAGKKFVMVIDLAKCKNARKCVDACQEGHMLPKDHEWIKLYLLQENNESSRYWFPRPCFHCDKPMCVSVCPVGATYKRHDGIVLVDNQRCIGCKFCMTGCPYSARVFNWKDPEVKMPEGHVYDPELTIPPIEGTVGKCVFCADKVRKNELPRCAAACPMGVIYFGDLYEDTVTNGVETLRFKKLLADRGGYRYREDLGTLPSVFYLPPTQRMFPVERGIDNQTNEIKERYKKAGPR